MTEAYWIMDYLENVTKEAGVVLTREESAKLYGLWFSEDATPDALVSWCTKWIKLYEAWIENCKRLRSKNQIELLKDVPKDILENYLANLNGGTTK